MVSVIGTPLKSSPGADWQTVQTVPAGTPLESIRIVFREYAAALGRTATGSHHRGPGIVTVIPDCPLRII